MAGQDRTVLSIGRLDGLVITPITSGAETLFLDFTVDTVPGLRLVVEVAAARELRDALAVILGPDPSSNNREEP